MSKGNPGNPRKSSKQKQIEALSNRNEENQKLIRALDEEKKDLNYAVVLAEKQRDQFSMQAASLNIDNANLRKNNTALIEVTEKQTIIITNLSEAIARIIARGDEE